MIVTDASVLVRALVDQEESGLRIRDQLALDRHWVAPGHVLVEVFSSIRGLVLGGKMTQEKAATAIDDLAEFSIEVVATEPLFPRMFELLPNLSAYDAAYVAAAEAMGCALVTADGRMARAPGIRCEVRLVGVH